MKVDVRDSEPTEAKAYLALNGFPGAGPVVRHRLLAAFGNPSGILRAGPAAIDAVDGVRPGTGGKLARWLLEFDAGREARRLEERGGSFITLGDSGYPAVLREIADPPLGLYRAGRYGFDRTAVAVIGSRKATGYGRSFARRLACELSAAGCCVVSGLALGIDTAAHEGALEGGGPTVAVLGSGLDVCYPPDNRELQRRIAGAGAVVTEFPLGRRPDKMTFPMRNRIVSGLCRAVVVVESGVDGGAMITARLAGDQGRLLFAVPGRADQETSAGCHQLIRDGATLVTAAEQVLEDLGPIGGRFRSGSARRARPSPARVGAGLAGAERLVYQCFAGGEALPLDRIPAGLPPARIAAVVTQLEIRGILARRLDGAYEAVSG